MKKILAVLFLSLMLCALVVPALAETGAIPETFFTWDVLLTLTGATLATTVIVQFIKLPADKVFGHIPTWVVVYIIALGLMLLAQLFAGDGLTLQSGALAALNAVIVAFAAMKTHEVYVNTEEKQLAKYIQESTKLDDEGTDATNKEKEDSEPPTDGGASK